MNREVDGWENQPGSSWHRPRQHSEYDNQRKSENAFQNIGIARPESPKGSKYQTPHADYPHPNWRSKGKDSPVIEEEPLNVDVRQQNQN